VEAQTQDRVALATLLLTGDSGLRRSEVAAARRDQLEKSRHRADVWLLTVVGKGQKERLVPVSTRTIHAIRDHWRDRHLDFDEAGATMPLLGPVTIPSTEAARDRHEEREAHGYHATSLYNLVETALRRVRTDGSALTDGELQSLTTNELVHLASSSPHAFRHTFATVAVERGMPLDLAQEILGHASITTTRVYVQARQKRIAAAAAEFFGGAATRHVECAEVDQSPTSDLMAAGKSGAETKQNVRTQGQPSAQQDVAAHVPAHI
jgi:integrase